MAIAPCHTCGRPCESDEYFLHDVACSAESCQAEKRAADARMEAILDRVSAEIRAREVAKS